MILLERASVATASDDAIIAVVDRGGNLLGVLTESGVSAALLANPDTKAFAIDGAIAEARTAAFFANDTAPLTSRTIQFISQSTITEREVNSDPNITDPDSTLRGPGFVARIAVNPHFPPQVPNTPMVDQGHRAAGEQGEQQRMAEATVAERGFVGDAEAEG